MIGKTLSHYRIVEKIGAGGMGEVYCARDEHLGRDVALKVLPAGTLADEQARKRFRKEALALSKLNHPNIATVHDFDTQDGVDFLVMELVGGVTLSDKLAVGPLPEKEISRLGAQLAEGLAAAHEQRVVHRDLKPANLRVTPDGRLKILDFGLAKLVRPEVASATATTESFTETQAAAGTLPYMAPEQVRAENVDARSDIYAAGAVLYEMATGQRAFPETQTGRLMDAILHQAPQPPSGLNRRVSPVLENIILKALDKEPERRYQSAKELLVDLRRLESPSTAAQVVPRPRLRWPYAVAAAAIAVALLAVGAFFYIQPAQALSETDYLLLTDFVNKTGDEVFDGTLKQALAIKLEESPFLNIVPEQRVRQALRFMDRSPEERVTSTVGQQICLRENIKAMMTGEIAALGSRYVLTLNAVNCATGDSLAREQVEADSKEEVLSALGKASSSMRGKLGESLSSLERLDTPLEQATTSSLEALQAFSLGERERARAREAGSVPFYQRAVELDPNFATAYARLGTVYSNLGRGNLSREHHTKAFELRDRVSRRERFYISTHYYSGVTGEIEKGIQELDLWRQVYPRDPPPWGNGSNRYRQTGQLEKALETAQEALRLDPNKWFAYNALGSAYRNLNRFEEARAIWERQLARNLDRWNAHENLYIIAFIEGDTASMEKHADWAVGKPDEFWMLSLKAATSAYGGELEEARERRRQAIELARRYKFAGMATLYLTQEAFMEAALGNNREARRKVAAALAASPGRNAQRIAAFALARAGDTRRAQSLADDLAKRFPKWTLLVERDLPTVYAAIELQRGNPTRALELLKPALRFEPTGFTAISMRGQAYLELGKGQEAAGEFQKILDHRGVAPVSIDYPLAQLGLARAHALAGDTGGARRAYQNFLALWKDADPDIPILLEAQAEYAKLQESVARPTN